LKKKQQAKASGGGAKKEKKEKKEEEAAPEAAGPSEPAVEDAPPESQDTVPSLAEQSKARSTSFRKASISTPLSPGLQAGPLSPGSETAPDIYRKQVGRIEELEKENKRLAKEAADSEKRWQKAEEELADLREADASGKPAGEASQVEKLVCRILRRQTFSFHARCSCRSRPLPLEIRNCCSPKTEHAAPSP